MHEMSHIALRVSAFLTGLLLFPGLPGAAIFGPAPFSMAPRPLPATLSSPLALPAAPAPRVCLTTTLCALKQQVRGKDLPWSEAECQRVAEAVESAAEEYQLSPALIVAVMMNESDLDEKAVASYQRDGKVYAKDGGLMGIRCVFDERGRCGNGFVKGMSFKKLMDPATNIALGARLLAYFRESGVETRTERVRGASGQVETRTRTVRCRHSNHAYWAHYNHGMRYIDHGEPRHYPHHVAVLYYELARGLGLPAPELQSRHLTVVDRGLRPRTADRPVEPRYRALCSKIRVVNGTCQAPALLFGQAPAPRPDLALQSRVDSPPAS
jgi:hypothetical protein